MKRTASIDQILRPLKESPFQAYLSNAVQVADILEWILEQVGVAEVWQTSFSISEASITQVIERTYLADNHSKILLLKSEAGDTVSVITSQNLTRGNRHESAFISTSPEIFENLHAQVNDLITNHSVPLHDLFRDRIAAD